MQREYGRQIETLRRKNDKFFWTLSIVYTGSKTHDVSETGVCLRHTYTPWPDQLCCPEIVTSYWALQSRCRFLHNDGDGLQSPKRRVFLIKDRRWIMSKNFVTLTHHRHKPSELTKKKGCNRNSKANSWIQQLTICNILVTCSQRQLCHCLWLTSLRKYRRIVPRRHRRLSHAAINIFSNHTSRHDTNTITDHVI
jgi:hypothetical protein